MKQTTRPRRGRPPRKCLPGAPCERFRCETCGKARRCAASRQSRLRAERRQLGALRFYRRKILFRLSRCGKTELSFVPPALSKVIRKWALARMCPVFTRRANAHV